MEAYTGAVSLSVILHKKLSEERFVFGVLQAVFIDYLCSPSLMRQPLLSQTQEIRLPPSRISGEYRGCNRNATQERGPHSCRGPCSGVCARQLGGGGPCPYSSHFRRVRDDRIERNGRVDSAPLLSQTQEIRLPPSRISGEYRGCNRNATQERGPHSCRGPCSGVCARQLGGGGPCPPRQQGGSGPCPPG